MVVADSAGLQDSFLMILYIVLWATMEIRSKYGIRFSTRRCLNRQRSSCLPSVRWQYRDGHGNVINASSLSSGGRSQRTITLSDYGVAIMAQKFSRAISFGLVLCVSTSLFAQSKTYTTQADFLEGVLNNAVAVSGTSDELQIAPAPQVLPNLWVACSERGTIVRIDTVTRTVVGEYWSAPQICDGVSVGCGGDPSRTTVDFDGNVWVGNRDDWDNGTPGTSGDDLGSVVKIGSCVAFQWVDRNNNLQLDTSSGLGDVRPWWNDDGSCDFSDAIHAQDELIMLYNVVPARGVRTVAVDRSNDVWVNKNEPSRRFGL